MTLTFPVRRTLLGVLTLLAMVSCFANPALAQGASAPEYELKAAILYNLAKFAEWPESGAQSAKVFRIGILGDDPFGSTLERTVANKRLRGKSISVARFETLADLQPVDMLFISQSAGKQLPGLLDQIRGKAILTVADDKRSSRMGAIVGLTKQGSRVRFVINADAARDANLRVSSKLLRLAADVYGDADLISRDRP